MTTRFDGKPAPSLLEGPYPQRLIDPDPGFWHILEKLISKRIFRHQWRRSRQRHRLEQLRRRSPLYAQMNKVKTAWQQSSAEPLTTEIVTAALAMLENRALVGLEDFAASEQAAMLAALCLALKGIPVHLVYADTPDARKDLQDVATVLGLKFAVISDGLGLEERRDAYSCNIVALGYRQLMFDYLMDQQAMGPSRGPLVSRLNSRLSDRRSTLLPGLACALIVGAREVLIDQATRPVGISEASEGRRTHVNSVYSEAIEIASQLVGGEHYFLAEDTGAPVLTDMGRDAIVLLSVELGPLWRGRERSEDIVRAALFVMRLHEGTDYVVSDVGVDIENCTAALERTGGYGKNEYKRLLRAKHETGGRNSAPPIVKRLSVQHFFPRYQHLASAGWLVQQRERELESVYQLVSLPNLAPASQVRAKLYLHRSTIDWQQALRNSLETLKEEGCNVLLLSPDEERRQLLHDALNPQWLSMLQLEQVSEAVTFVGGVFMSLTIEEALALDASQLPGSQLNVIFAATPNTILEEALVCHRYAREGSAKVYGSFEDPLFESLAMPLKMLCSRSRLAYNFFRERLELNERKSREQVAAHDAYVRQTLAFSGDTL